MRALPGHQGSGLQAGGPRGEPGGRLCVRSWEAGSRRARGPRDMGLPPGAGRGAPGAALAPLLCLSGLTDCLFPSSSLPFSLDFPANIRGLGGATGGPELQGGSPILTASRTQRGSQRAPDGRAPPSHLTGSAFWEIPRTSTSNSATELCISAVTDLTSRTFCSLIYSIRSLCYGYSASSLQEYRRYFKQASSP